MLEFNNKYPLCHEQFYLSNFFCFCCTFGRMIIRSFLFISIAMTSCAFHESKTVLPQFANNVVVAHRGAFKKNGFPENSIASLKEAIRLGCTGAEFDVRMTADDVLVINHDPQFHGLDIEGSTYAQLSANKLSNGEMFPTLKDYLHAGIEKNLSTRLVLEIKPSSSKERGKLIAERVIDRVKKSGAEKLVAYISFDYDILKRLEELDATVVTQYLNGDVSPEQLKADRIDGADYHFSVFKTHPEWIMSAKKNKLILNAWTVNEEADMKWLLAEKFDFITTNEPEKLLSLMGNK